MSRMIRIMEPSGVCKGKTKATNKRMLSQILTNRTEISLEKSKIKI